MIAGGDSACMVGWELAIREGEASVDLERSSHPRAGLSDYLAAERTLLAWIRTGLALMGFGVLVARFGVFIEEQQPLDHFYALHARGFSLWFGMALLLVGVTANLFAGWHYLRLAERLDNGVASGTHRSMAGVAIAALLALVGLVMAAYLISVRALT